eukprot:tig00001024_g6322.t1
MGKGGPKPAAAAAPRRPAPELEIVFSDRAAAGLPRKGDAQYSYNTAAAVADGSDDEGGPVVYRLELMRPYRLALRTRDGAQRAAWAGAALGVRLLYGDDLSAVCTVGKQEPAPLLLFATGEDRPGEPAEQALLEVDPRGLTAPAFGIFADTARHQGRPFLLLVEGAPPPPPPQEPGSAHAVASGEQVVWRIHCRTGLGPPPKRPASSRASLFKRRRSLEAAAAKIKTEPAGEGGAAPARSGGGGTLKARRPRAGAESAEGASPGAGSSPSVSPTGTLREPEREPGAGQRAAAPRADFPDVVQAFHTDPEKASTPYNVELLLHAVDMLGIDEQPPSPSGSSSAVQLAAQMYMAAAAAAAAGAGAGGGGGAAGTALCTYAFDETVQRLESLVGERPGEVFWGGQAAATPVHSSIGGGSPRGFEFSGPGPPAPAPLPGAPGRAFAYGNAPQQTAASHSWAAVPVAFATGSGPPALPFRHASEAERAAAVRRVEAALQHVRRVAAQCGIAHPSYERERLPRGRGRPSSHVHPAAGAADFTTPRTAASPALQDACTRLAAALEGPQLFDTALFRSFGGRFRLRQMLADLRLSGSADLTLGVLHRWHAHVRPDEALCAYREGALLVAEAAWDLIAVVTGPLSLAAPDLFAVDRPFLFVLLDRADLALRAHAGPAGGDPELRARALAARAREHFHYDEAPTALELYFEAWAALLRGGHSPSRAESRVLRELVDVLSRVPGRADLAAHLAGKLYWVEGGDDDEDAAHRALVLHTMGIVAHGAGQTRRAKELLEASLAGLAHLPPEYRLYSSRVHVSLLATLTASWDVRAALPVLSGRRTIEGALHLGDPSAPEWDGYHAMRVYAVHVFVAGQQPVGYRRMTAEGLARIMRASLGIVERYEAGTPLHAHLLCLAGDVFALCGHPARALAAYEDAAARYGALPQYFPPSTPRLRALRDAILRTRHALAASSSPGPAPAPAAAPVGFSVPGAPAAFGALPGAHAGFGPPPGAAVAPHAHAHVHVHGQNLPSRRSSRGVGAAPAPGLDLENPL